MTADTPPTEYRLELSDELNRMGLFLYAGLKQTKQSELSKLRMSRHARSLDALVRASFNAKRTAEGGHPTPTQKESNACFVQKAR